MEKLEGKQLENYWTERYKKETTGWDIGEISTPLKEYIDQLSDKSLKIFIPGAGNAHEAKYLYNLGFKNVDVLDISTVPLMNLKANVPDFPAEQLIHGDFFKHEGNYDLILEQTFFCSFEPLVATRKAYAKQISTLLKPKGKLVGLWFKHPLDLDGSRPFGGSKSEYLSYLQPYLNVKTFEDCYNSIAPRMGNELFGIMQKA